LADLSLLAEPTRLAVVPWLLVFFISGATSSRCSAARRGGRLSRARIAEFVRLKVDVIVTHATPNVLAAKQGTSVVPIVFSSAGDPVGNKLVTSLARPGGNVTGLSVQSSELAQKVVDLLRDFLPKHGRLA
jgi:hypothetical protein